ncbi:hypothetical protein TNIN_314821 [Trichonephila inaurata madagascariensis]|uniref:Uncharacterized protein n=1 Tax=Trichonephila inaurata madagascariensis TaxID=2747483 RepID=A0A8X6XP10_9ARAC|nr:hypothetical protein TNIN_314821 [Trichonephila inaurata madagascariensis]
MNRDEVFCNLVDKIMIPYFYAGCFPVNFDSCSIEPFAAQNILTDEYNSLIIKAMCVQSRIINGKWQDFFEECSEYLRTTPPMYIISVVSMCLVVVDFTADIYERFLSVCSLIIQAGKFICKDNGSVYYKLNPYILKAFYAEVLKDAFYKRGGWKCLEGYLRKQDYINLKNRIDDAESDSEKWRLTAELSNYIKEKIKTLEYDPSEMTRKKLEDSPTTVAKDITPHVLSSIEYPLLEELINSTLSEGKQIIYSFDEPTASNSKSTLLPISNNATSVSSGEIKMLGLHEVPEATRAESISESEENGHETVLFSIEKLVHKNVSSTEVPNLSASNTDTLHDVMKTLDQFKHKIEYLILAFDSLDSHIKEK